MVWWHMFMWGDYLIITWICPHGNQCCIPIDLYPDRKVVIPWP